MLRDTNGIFRSLAAMFGLAFVTKYLILANLTTSSDAGFLKRIFENPGKEALTYFLDIQAYSAGTGYIQFFVVALYLFALWMMPRKLM